MTASEKVAVKSAQKASFGKVFAVQIAAYVVLVVLALIPGISYGNAEESPQSCRSRLWLPWR